LNLILQAIILVVLGLAIYARLRHNYVKHAMLMGSGIVLHTVAIFAIMVPSLLSMGVPFRSLGTGFASLTILHATVGSLVEIIGIWLVATWVLLPLRGSARATWRSNTASVEKCFKRKNVMRVTIALWVTELILGIFIYMMLYPPA
jgi:uncharacterized membrane protein YozB (DUF420 family)